MLNCSNEAENTRIGIAGGTLLCESEAVGHRRPRYPDPDSGTLDRFDNCAELAAFVIQEAINVRGQSTWEISGKIHCSRMVTYERHD